MRSQSGRAVVRTVTVVTFLVACTVFTGYLWTQAGGHLPVLTSTEDDYTFSADIADVDNLVPHADVAVAGINVGKVTTMERVGDRMRVTMRLDPDAAPLHEGATVQVSEKSLVGQPYLRLVDGQGPEIPAGSVLPPEAVRPSVQLHEVLEGLDPQAREDLGETLRSLGVATADTRESIGQLMDGLGELGAGGYTAVDAIAAQSEDLKHLAGQLTVALDALHSGHDDLGRLVRSGNTLVSATAGQRDALEASVRELPGTLGAVQSATRSLEELAGPLSPIAADLTRAAPDLNAALTGLPAVTRDLRGMLPPLGGVLDQVPATLDRVPALAGDVHALAPQLRERLRDVNPMLAYLSPYGRDIGGFIANFSASFAHRTTDGRNVLALFAVGNEQSVRGLPVDLQGGVLTGANPYPAPGGQANLAPFSGEFPRLYRDPN